MVLHVTNVYKFSGYFRICFTRGTRCKIVQMAKSSQPAPVKLSNKEEEHLQELKRELQNQLDRKSVLSAFVQYNFVIILWQRCIEHRDCKFDKNFAIT